jgi:uncharacterized membrane protein YsdA (DUF1294 family)/cold shock CspA family protein
MPQRQTQRETAKIIEWNQEKGFGYLQHGDRRVFLHWRDFAVRHRRPEKGDVVLFTLSKDAKGRPCATRAVQVNRFGRISLGAWAELAILLVLPAIAVHRQGVNLLWAAGYVVVIGAITYCQYAADKNHAKSKAWRIPEAQLHALELLGGWPAGFLAQRRLRHKCVKGSYQFVFWMIVLLHQYSAVDSLHDWKMTRGVFNAAGALKIEAASIVEIFKTGNHPSAAEFLYLPPSKRIPGEL